MYVQTILAFMAEKQKAQKSYKGEWGIVKWGQKFGFARLKSTRDWFHNNVNMLNT